MNTQINYLYRDADNYKSFNNCVIRGQLTPEQKSEIKGCLEHGEFFIPSLVGLPEEKFGTETSADHEWFEWIDAEDTDLQWTVGVTAEELVAKFREMAHYWKPDESGEGGMLRPYVVSIREIMSKQVVIWAKSYDEAENIGYDLCVDGTIELNDNDYSGRECEWEGVANTADLNEHKYPEYDKNGEKFSN